MFSGTLKSLALQATLCALLAVTFAGCGSDTNFTSESGTLDVTKRGAIVGHFLLRLTAGLTVDMDELKRRIEALVPEHRVYLAKRFEGIDGDIKTTATTFDQLLKLSIEGIAVEGNRALFQSLKELTDPDGNLYFSRVDTDKFLLNSTYDMVAIDDPGYRDASQYYLDMIRWSEAMEDVRPEELARAVPVVAAVFDTGVDAAHEDLQDVLWQDPENARVNGFDAFEGRGMAAFDRHGHGTAVAGLIGARGRNGKGIHGAGFLTPDGSDESVTEIMSVTVLDEEGGGKSDTIGKAIYWAVARHKAQRAQAGRENQKLILNLSLAGPFDVDGYAYDLGPDGMPVFEDDMFAYARENDVLIVAAAGNESCGIGGLCGIEGQSFNKTYYYPCSYAGVLCVAASTHEDRLAGLSNRRESIGMVAPGWSMYTTVTRDNGERGYGYFSGTSEASPMVAAAASVIWSMFPRFAADEIEAILMKSAAHIAAIQTEIDKPSGRLDLYAALQFARQLEATGASPHDVEPDVVSSDAITPLRAPDRGGDPYRQSADAYGAEAPPASSGGGGDEGGGPLACGTLGPRQTGGFWLILLLLPLILTCRSFAKRRLEAIL